LNLTTHENLKDSHKWVNPNNRGSIVKNVYNRLYLHAWYPSLIALLLKDGNIPISNKIQSETTSRKQRRISPPAINIESIDLTMGGDWRFSGLDLFRKKRPFSLLPQPSTGDSKHVNASQIDASTQSALMLRASPAPRLTQQAITSMPKRRAMVSEKSLRKGGLSSMAS